MNDKQVQEIRERIEQASPGPWHLGAFGIHTGSRDENGDVDPDVMRADMDLIAHAREDIPALLAERDAMRAGIDEVIALIQEARLASRPLHFSEHVDDILIRAINAGRAAQEGASDGE